MFMHFFIKYVKHFQMLFFVSQEFYGRKSFNYRSQWHKTGSFVIVFTYIILASLCEAR